jgi:hypothetical protein
MTLVIDLKEYRISKAIQEAAERFKSDMHCVKPKAAKPLSSKELLQQSRDLEVSLNDLIMALKKS